MNIANQLNKFSEAIKLCHILGDARFVGGCVRDILAKREVHDIDLATPLLPNEIEQKLKQHQINYHIVGKEFGTISVIFPSKVIEITTLRKDISCDGRYAKVEFTENWKEDASRRDFTINAISSDCEGNLYDYFGGIEDLNNCIVKFIGNAEERIKEDYLRILRFFRFSSYFAKNINIEGLEASIKYSSNLKNLSKERIKSELFKIFTSPNVHNILIYMEKSLKNLFKIEGLANKIQHLNQVVEDFGYKPLPILYAAILGLKTEDLSFTKEEKELLSLISKSDIPSWEYKQLKQVLRIYKLFFKEVVYYNIVNKGVIFNNNSLTTDLKKLFSLDLKELPISGRDLLQHNFTSGTMIGKMLLEAEKIWYDKEFQISKEQLFIKTLKYANI